MCVSALGMEGRTLSHLHKSTYCVGHRQPSSPPNVLMLACPGASLWGWRGSDGVQTRWWRPRSFLLLLPRDGEKGERAGAVVACIVVGKTSFYALYCRIVAVLRTYVPRPPKKERIAIVFFLPPKIGSLLQGYSKKKTKHDEKQSTAND